VSVNKTCAPRELKSEGKKYFTDFQSSCWPIVIDATLAYVSKPSLRLFFYLSAAQIAAVGMSGSAVFVTPLLALLTAMAYLSGPGKASGRVATLMGVAGTSLYPVLVAGLVTFCYARPGVVLAPIRSTLVKSSISYVFGSGPFAYACVLVVAGVCFLTGAPVARRLGRFCALFALLVVSNPLLAPFLAENLMGADVYWRLYWTLPLPLFAGLFCCIPLELLQVHVPRGVRFTAYAAVLLMFMVVLPRQRIFDVGNRVRLGKPGLKVPPFYGTIQAVAANLHSEDSVLMPDELSPWLPTLHNAARPVLARQAYARLYPPDKRATVCAAQAFISRNGTCEDGSEALVTLVRSMDIRAVLFSGHLDHAAEIVGILKRHGFTVSATSSTAPYALYVRTEPRVHDLRHPLK